MSASRRVQPEAVHIHGKLLELSPCITPDLNFLNHNYKLSLLQAAAKNQCREDIVNRCQLSPISSHPPGVSPGIHRLYKNTEE